MSARGSQHLLIGLDGASLEIVQRFGSALPQLHSAMARGAYAPLRSVLPPATLPNWTTLLTGYNPGRHGVFDFTLRTGYRVQFSAGSIRNTPTWVAQLDRLGQSCACLFFPGTFPPERLQHGLYVSGWDAPVAFEADASFVWPRTLYREIVERFGPERFDEADQFDAESPGWHSQLSATLCKRIERRVELARWLLTRQRFDLFAIYFGESDTAAHHLWSLHDAASPRRPHRVSAHDQAGLLRVYQALDSAVGELIAAAGGESVEVTIVSDHGSGGASDKVLYLNRALEAAGLLRFRRRTPADWALRSAKDLALTRLSPRLRERLFRGFHAFLPGLVESRARFAAIDMPRTRVFSDELNYFPALHYNLRGREPQGTLDAADVPALRVQLEAALYALRDPYTGGAVVSRVSAREELFHGPCLSRAPDLLLELALDDGYSYNLMPSSSAPAGSAAFRRLSEAEFLGRKGRSLPGSHRDRGLYIACGPRVRAVGEIDAAMADVSATVLARMPPCAALDFDGRVLHEILHASDRTPRARAPAASREAPPGSAAPTRGAARVEERLRRLGYIE